MAPNKSTKSGDFARNNAAKNRSKKNQSNQGAEFRNAPAKPIPTKPEGGQTFQIGNKLVTKNEYDAYKAMAGFDMPAAVRLNPAVQQIIKEKTAEQAALQAQTEADKLAAIGNLGLTPEQQALSLESEGGVTEDLGVLAAGAAAAGPTAGIGAAIGSAIVPGAGTAVGAGIGYAAGFVGGVFTKVSLNKKNDVKTAKTVATTSYSNMQWIINEVNLGRMSPSEAVYRWDEEMANFRAAQRALKLETEAVTSSFVDAEDELANIESISRRLGAEEIRLQAAILTPNPRAVQYTQTLQSLNE